MSSDTGKLITKPVFLDLILPGNPDKIAFCLDYVFTKEECEDFIKATEQKGYIPATLNFGRGRHEFVPMMRNSTHCTWDSVEIAADIWRRIQLYIPAQFRDKTVVGLNKQLRFLRYERGEYFRPHLDGSRDDGAGALSMLTVQLYLNEGFEGGETTFFSNDMEKSLPCTPKIGRVVVFEHDVLHEGSEVKAGRKYAMRTDVFYKQD